MKKQAILIPIMIAALICITETAQSQTPEINDKFSAPQCDKASQLLGSCPPGEKTTPDFSRDAVPLFSSLVPVEKLDSDAQAAYRTSAWDASILNQAIPGGVDQFTVELPDERQVRLVVTDSAQRESARRISYQRVRGDVWNSKIAARIGVFSLTRTANGGVSGKLSIFGQEVSYSIVSNNDSQGLMLRAYGNEVGDCAVPDSTQPVTPKPEVQDNPADDAAGGAATGVGGHSWPEGDPIIDMLIVYTQNAVNDLGGQAAMDALVIETEQSMNDSLGDSFVATRVRLIHSQLITPSEVTTNCQATFDDLVNVGGANAEWDMVQELRNELGADIVHLIVGNGTCCGKARLLLYTEPGQEYSEPNGYMMTKESCTVAKHSAAHELGHSLGGGHDNSPGYYNISQGYHFTAEGTNYGTVVSRNQTGRTRLPYYSSPQLAIEVGAPGNLALLGTPLNDNRRTFTYSDDGQFPLSTSNIVSQHRERCVPLCDGDVDQNGETDFADALAILIAWGTAPSNVCTYEDLDKDGEVAFSDILEVIVNWGSCI